MMSPNVDTPIICLKILSALAGLVISMGTFSPPKHPYAPKTHVDVGGLLSLGVKGYNAARVV